MKNWRKCLYGLLVLVTASACSLPKKLDIIYDFSTGTLENRDALNIQYLGTPAIVIRNIDRTQYTVNINQSQSSVVFGSSVENTEITRTPDSSVFIQPIARGDEINYVVEIIETAVPDRKVLVPITVRVGGRWKLDVSTGINFLTGSLDEQYEISEDANVFSLAEVDDQNTLIPASISAMTHFYRKQPGQVNWGGSFGIGIQDNGKVRYFGGLGVMFGDRQRGILNVGAYLAQKHVKNEKYDDKYEYTSTELPGDLLIEAWKIGWFVGIGYNLTSSEN